MVARLAADGAFVYAVDRNGAGLDILRVTGKAKRAAIPNDHSHHEDDD